MTINGKGSNVETNDLLSCGRSMGLPSHKSRRILGEVAEAVADWMEIAADVGIREETAKAIRDRTCCTREPLLK